MTDPIRTLRKLAARRYRRPSDQRHYIKVALKTMQIRREIEARVK